MLKLSIIADIHHGPDFETKKGSAALGLMDGFLAHVAQTNPDAVVDLGDRITDTDHDNDVSRLHDIAAKFKTLSVPRFHLMGNHDCGELSLLENETILQHPLTSHSIDLHGFHLVFWNCKTKTQPQGFLELAEGDLGWLQDNLGETRLPSVIFSHVPLDNGSMKGNYYFEKEWPQYGNYSEEAGKEIRDVIEHSGKVILCINSHAHWNAYHCIDGIHYVTIPSLTETFTTHPYANESWADLIISDNIKINIHGLAPMSYVLPIKELHTRWKNLHRTFYVK